MAPGNLYRHSIVGQESAYGAIAPVYDRLMAHVEYDRWMGLIKAVCRRYCRGTKSSIFEIGGGTGTLGRMLMRCGFPYIGSDASAAMCTVACEKRLPFFCADGRRLPLRRSFDLIIFLYDGINYLRKENDYRRLFTEVSQCLDSNGAFLFDVTTEANSLAHFYDYIDFEDYGDASYIRHSYYNHSKKFQHNDFTIFRRVNNAPGYYTKHTERHVQRVLSPAEITRLIPSDTFAIEGVWDGFSRKPATRNSERIHFLLRKK